MLKNGDLLSLKDLLQIRERIEEMFNMHQVGKRIAQLRKQRNMTQLELADFMNISYQAVSNWERGSSMPDISKLPELAEILQVSLDELLGEKSPLLESVIENKVEEYVAENEIVSGELENVLPLLKPAQVEQMEEQAEEKAAEQSAKLNFEKISGFLPFISTEKVDELAMKALVQGENISRFFPFMSDKKLEELAERAMARGESISAFLPFLSQKYIDELVMRVLLKD